MRPWKEDESPFALLAGAWRDSGHSGPLAIEPTTRYFLVERTVAAAPTQPSIVPGDDLVRACRMVKSIRGGAALREALTRAPSLVAMRDLIAAAAQSAGRDEERGVRAAVAARELVYPAAS